MERISLSSATVDTIKMPLYQMHAIEVSVLRLDKIHPVISGNKWFKLQHYLQEAKRSGNNNIITFGGAYSNHIVATAAACKLSGLHSSGIIRAEDVNNHTLETARSLGMQLYFITRDEYKAKHIPIRLTENDMIIPEGGYGPTGASGAAGIADLFDEDKFDYVIVACGTGTMAAGLANALKNKLNIEAYSVLKNEASIASEIKMLLNDDVAPPVIRFHHFGGYAKKNSAVIHEMNEFYKHTGIATDFVYTGKLIAGFHQEIKNNRYAPGSRILLVHSGGLQGNESLPKGTLIF